MRTMHLLLGNSEQLLTNFIEVLAQDACAEEGLVSTTSVRTVEALILQGLTGRFDLAIVIPNNLVPDSIYVRERDAFSEAAEAVRILKKRCPIPVLVAAVFNQRPKEETLLRQAGADSVRELPFHPEELAGKLRDLLKRSAREDIRLLSKPRSSRAGVGAVTRWGASLRPVCQQWFESQSR